VPAESRGDEIVPPYLVVCDSLFQRHMLAYEILYFQGYEQVLRLIPRLTKAASNCNSQFKCLQVTS
jgi:hypothetical protein